MMKKGEIVLLIFAVAVVLVFSGCSSQKDPTPQQATGCDWRPSSEQPFGLCKAIVGVYFDGKECKSIGGCPDEAAGKPASMMSTFKRSSCLAISSFSSGVREAPGHCSPSRSVVSKI
mgnify:CR=1 FL=1